MFYEQISREEVAARFPAMTTRELADATADAFEKLAVFYRRQAQGLPVAKDETPCAIIRQAFGGRPYALIFITHHGDRYHVRGASFLAGDADRVANQILAKGLNQAAINQIRQDRAKSAALAGPAST